MRCGAVFLAEATWATKLEIQQAVAIKSYFRFKDDIWILACDRGLARRFISRFRNLAAKVFESELVECSQQSVEMVGVITVIENGKIHTEPRPKDKGPPLSVHSAHPAKVHLRWPAAHLRAELDLCSTESRRVKVKDSFIKRFQASYAPRFVMNSLLDVPLFKMKKEMKESNEKIKWFSLPFHPAVRGINLGSAIGEFVLIQPGEESLRLDGP